MRLLISTHLACLSLLVWATAAGAGDDVWTKIGPYGNRISALVVNPLNPQVVYAGSATGRVFKSTDGGESWGALPQALGYGRALAMTPADPPVIHAGGWGVARSVDRGGVWTRTNTGLASLNVLALQAAPSNPQTLYVSTSGGIHKSTDGGSSWVMVNAIASTAFRALAVDPANPQIVYFSIGASDPNRGLYKSMDGGGVWTRLPLDPPDGASVEGLAIDPSYRQTVYAATGGAGVFKSTDGGASWTPVNVGLTNLRVFTVVADPSRLRTVYAGTADGGVYRSANDGASWTRISSGLRSREGVETLTLDPFDAQRIYAGTRDGVYRSVDGGASWTQPRLPTSSISALAPSNSRTLYIGTSYGEVFKTGDGGGRWTRLNVELSTWSTLVNVLTVDPSNDQTVYIGLWGAGYKSTDGGASWVRTWSPSIETPPGRSPTSVRAIAVDPLNPETLYLGTMGFTQPREVRLLKSVDGGKTWDPSDSGLPPERQYVSRIVIAPSNPRTLYLVHNQGTENGFSYDTRERVFRSTDGGASWTDATNGLPQPAFPNGQLQPVSWTIAVDPADEKVIYAGLGPYSGDVRVYRSVDGGNSWTAAGSGLPALSIQSLAVDPTDPQTVYAGTILGVYRSTDKGASWKDFSAGLDEKAIGHLTVDPASRTVYAGTSEGSVYAIRLTEAEKALQADFDGNRAVDFDDFFMFAGAFGQKATGGYAKFDLDGDGEVGLSDLFLFADRFGKKAQ